MAIPKIKATYALDPETMRALEHMARRWKVSKSEVLRRAIRAAATGGAAEETSAVAALGTWTIGALVGQPAAGVVDRDLLTLVVP